LRQKLGVAGREDRNLLVPDMQPLGVAVPPQRIGDAVEAVAGDAVDALHAHRGERLRQWSATVFAMSQSPNPNWPSDEPCCRHGTGAFFRRHDVCRLFD
jgi:hypothetical protein